MDRRQPCVYMLASKKYGVLYIGVTSDLVKRSWQHKNDVVEGPSLSHLHTGLVRTSSDDGIGDLA